MEETFEGRSACPSSSSFSPFSFLAFASISINTVINIISIINANDNNNNNNNNNNLNDLTSMNMNTGAGRRRKRSLEDVFDLDRLEEILLDLESVQEESDGDCKSGFAGFLNWMQEILLSGSGSCLGHLLCEGRNFLEGFMADILTSGLADVCKHLAQISPDCSP